MHPSQTIDWMHDSQKDMALVKSDNATSKKSAGSPSKSYTYRFLNATADRVNSVFGKSANSLFSSPLYHSEIKASISNAPSMIPTFQKLFTELSIPFEDIPSDEVNISWYSRECTDDQYISQINDRFHVINRAPGLQNICRKRNLSIWLNELLFVNPDLFSFLPPSHSVPGDVSSLLTALPFNHPSSTCDSTEWWIFKPSRGRHGQGMHLVRCIKDIPPSVWEGLGGLWVAQRFITNPLLVARHPCAISSNFPCRFAREEGETFHDLTWSKFDLRVYLVLLPDCGPKGECVAYLHSEGLVRVSVQPFQSLSALAAKGLRGDDLLRGQITNSSSSFDQVGWLGDQAPTECRSKRLLSGLLHDLDARPHIFKPSDGCSVPSSRSLTGQLFEIAQNVAMSLSPCVAAEGWGLAARVSRARRVLESTTEAFPYFPAGSSGFLFEGGSLGMKREKCIPPSDVKAATSLVKLGSQRNGEKETQGLRSVMRENAVRRGGEDVSGEILINASINTRDSFWGGGSVETGDLLVVCEEEIERGVVRDAAKRIKYSGGGGVCRSAHIIGLDVLLDGKGKAWLLEANANPSLRTIEAGTEAETDEGDLTGLEYLASTALSPIKSAAKETASHLGGGLILAFTGHDVTSGELSSDDSETPAIDEDVEETWKETSVSLDVGAQNDSIRPIEKPSVITALDMQLKTQILTDWFTLVKNEILNNMHARTRHDTFAHLRTVSLRSACYLKRGEQNTNWVKLAPECAEGDVHFESDLRSETEWREIIDLANEAHDAHAKLLSSGGMRTPSRENSRCTEGWIGIKDEITCPILDQREIFDAANDPYLSVHTPFAGLSHSPTQHDIRNIFIPPKVVGGWQRCLPAPPSNPPSLPLCELSTFLSVSLSLFSRLSKWAILSPPHPLDPIPSSPLPSVYQRIRKLVTFSKFSKFLKSIRELPTSCTPIVRLFELTPADLDSVWRRFVASRLIPSSRTSPPQPSKDYFLALKRKKKTLSQNSRRPSILCELPSLDPPSLPSLSDTTLKFLNPPAPLPPSTNTDHATKSKSLGHILKARKMTPRAVAVPDRVTANQFISQLPSANVLRRQGRVCGPLITIARPSIVSVPSLLAADSRFSANSAPVDSPHPSDHAAASNGQSLWKRLADSLAKAPELFGIMKPRKEWADEEEVCVTFLGFTGFIRRLCDFCMLRNGSCEVFNCPTEVYVEFVSELERLLEELTLPSELKTNQLKITTTPPCMIEGKDVSTSIPPSEVNNILSLLPEKEINSQPPNSDNDDDGLSVT